MAKQQISTMGVAPITDRTGRGVGFAVSIVLHAGLVYALGSTFLTPPEEPKEPEKVIEAVLIRTVQPRPTPPPPPEPGSEASPQERPIPDPRPRSIAPRVRQTRVAVANVSRMSQVVTPQITQIAPQVQLGEVSRVDVNVRTTQAPTQVQQRFVENAKVVDALQVRIQQPTSATVSANTQLKAAPTLGANAGPRRTDAAGPIQVSNAVAYQEATLSNGVIDSFTQQGDPDGPRIRSATPGTASVLSGGGGSGGGGDGDGPGGNRGRGIGPGEGDGVIKPVNRDCNRDLQCKAYLDLIKQAVYSRWNPDGSVPGGAVQLRFKIDKSGAAHEISIAKSDSGPLGESCMTAFRHANPFSPPPASIRYLVDKTITATFEFEKTAKGG